MYSTDDDDDGLSGGAIAGIGNRKKHNNFFLCLLKIIIFSKFTTLKLYKNDITSITQISVPLNEANLVKTSFQL